VKKAQINLLVKWSLIAIVVTVMPLLAFNVVSKANDMSCKNALLELEGRFRAIRQELINSGRLEFAVKRACKIDTISLFEDYNSSSILVTSNLSNSESVRSSDGEKPNVFFFENKKIMHSFNLPGIKISGQHNLCIDSRGGDIRLLFEKEDDKIRVKHLDNKLNCGPVDVTQIPLDESLKKELFDKSSGGLGELPEDIDVMQINAMNNAEISREIVCMNENEADIKITIRAKEGRKLKDATYIEIIDRKCPEKIGSNNIDIYNHGVSGIYEITNINTEIRNNSMIIWQLKDAHIAQLPVTLSYSVNKCIRDCRQDLIKSVFYAKKVFNLDIEDEVAKIIPRLPEPKMIDAVKSAVRKGEFDIAIKESLRISDMLKDVDAKILIDELIEEINSMKTESERID